MSARSFCNAKRSRQRPRKNRDYRLTVESLETLQLLSAFGDFFTNLGNDIVSTGEQVAGDIVSFGQQVGGEITNGAEQAIGAIQGFGQQLISTVSSDAQMVASTVTNGLTQIGTAIDNTFTNVGNTVGNAFVQLGSTISSGIEQITGQVTNELQSVVEFAASNVSTAEADLSSAFNAASSNFTSAFEQFGNQLQSTFTNPAVEAGLSYSIDGLMVLGGVALIASSVFDGPAGDLSGATLIGAGIQGIEYNVENTNHDGTVNGNWSWSGFGENLGIGGATGFVSGGLGLAGAEIGGGVLVGAATGAASGVFDQFLTNAANGQSPGTNLGAAAGFGALGGAVFGGLSSYVGSQAGTFEASSTGDLVGGVDSALGSVAQDGSDASTSLDQSLDDLAMEAGLDVSDMPNSIPVPDGETEVAIPVPNEAPAPVTGALPGSTSSGVRFALTQVLKDSLRTFVAPQASGIASSTLSQLESLLSVSGGSTTPPTPQQLGNDLSAYFTAATTPAPNGYLQSVTSVALPFASGTALVGIGGDNAVYVNEQVPGTGSTGWVDLGGYLKSIAVTTFGAQGLPAIFGLGADNAIYVNQQNTSGRWTGWNYISQGGTFQSITATVSPFNTPEVFAIGLNNAVYTQWEGNTPGTWSGLVYLGGNVEQLAATSNANGATGVFALGADNSLYYTQYTSGQGWSGWSYISQGGTFKQIAAGQSNSNSSEVYAVGFNDAIYTEAQNGTSWTSLTYLGGDVRSIAASPSDDGTVYAVDISNNAVEDRYTFGGGDANLHGYWTGFSDLGAGFKAVTAAGTQVYGLGPDNHVYALNAVSGKTDVGGYTPTMALGGDAVDVAIGSDHSVYVDEQNPNGSWTGAIDLGGTLKSISTVQTSNSLPVVFAIDFANLVWANEQTPSGGWTGWEELPTSIQASKIVGALAPNGQPEVIASNASGVVFTTSQNPNGSWNGWYATGGTVQSFAVTQDPSGGAAIAGIGMNNAIWVDQQRADGTWSGFTSLGGSFQSVSAAQAPDGGVAIVGLGTNGNVSVDEESFGVDEVNYGSPAAWGGFVNLGGNYTSVEAVNSGFGTLEILTMDSSGNESLDAQLTNDQWSGFTVIAKPKTSSSTTS